MCSQKPVIKSKIKSHKDMDKCILMNEKTCRTIETGVIQNSKGLHTYWVVAKFLIDFLPKYQVLGRYFTNFNNSNST